MLTDRMFIHTKSFDKQWASLCCTDDDLSKLQKAINDNPQAHPVIRGTGGVRKTRFAIGARGKSGGVRIIYGDFPEYGIVYLLDAYPKSDKENITEDERKLLKSIMNTINTNWRDRK